MVDARICTCILTHWSSFLNRRRTRRRVEHVCLSGESLKRSLLVRASLRAWMECCWGRFTPLLTLQPPASWLSTSDRNAVTEQVLIGHPSSSFSGSAGEADQRQGPAPDCTVGMFKWKQWSDDKKQLCCRTQRIACEKDEHHQPAVPPVDLYDCEVGRVNWQSWGSEKKTWCCEEKHVGCVSQSPHQLLAPFDCNDNYVSSYHSLLNRWSESKREWCCHHGGRGCPTPPPPPPRELPKPLRAMTPPGRITLPSGTPPPPQAHYQHAATKPPPEAPQSSTTLFQAHHQRAATKPPPDAPKSSTTLSRAHHQRAATKPPPEAPKSSAALSQAHQQRAATKPPPEAPKSSTTLSQEALQFPVPPATEVAAASSALFRPDLAVAHPAEITTTSAKSAKAAAIAATSFPFTCTAGLAHWEKGWSLRKKAWCCQHEQRGCPPTDKDLPYNCEDMRNTWSDKKKAWCCQHNGAGCPATGTTNSEPFDCEAGAANWKRGWSSKKKEWCCRHAHVGAAWGDSCF